MLISIINEVLDIDKVIHVCFQPQVDMTINTYLVHMTHVLVSIHSLLNMDTSCKQDPRCSLIYNLLCNLVRLYG